MPTRRRAPNLYIQQSKTAIELSTRYRMMTAPALAKLRHGLYPTEQIASRVLQRLVDQGELRVATLVGKQMYFFVANDQANSGLSENAKIRNYAMLLACTGGKTCRSRLSRDDFEKYFPDLRRRGQPMNYYVDLSGGHPILGFLRIDMGGHGRWDRIIAKAHDDARKHRLEPACERFIERGAFEIRIVTSLQSKHDRIVRTLAERPSHAGIPIRVTVAPKLLNLIAPTKY